MNAKMQNKISIKSSRAVDDHTQNFCKCFLFMLNFHARGLLKKKKNQIVLCFEHSSETKCAYFLLELLDLRLLLALWSREGSVWGRSLGLSSNFSSVGRSWGTPSWPGSFYIYRRKWLDGGL